MEAELWYDPLGRLYKVQTPSGITHFLYDGDELVAEYNGTSTTVKDRYIHGASVDDPVAWFQSSSVTVSTRRYLRANHQGSIVAVTNASTSMLSLPRYDTWGKPQQNHPLRFGYTGQAWIEELGLWHYKARFYSPRLGRFLQTDPVGYEDQMNLYAYVHNDPLTKFDPTGKQTEDIVVTGERVRNCSCSIVHEARLDLVMRASNALSPLYHDAKEQTRMLGFMLAMSTLSDGYMLSDQIDGSNPYKGETPDDKPEDFEDLGPKVGHKSKPRKKRSDGSVWERDRDGHGGGKWKRWPSKRDWEKGKGRRSVRPNGSVVNGPGDG